MVYACVLVLLGLITMIYGPISGQLDVLTAFAVGALCLTGAVFAFLEADE